MMLKLIPFCFLFAIGCQPIREYTVHQEYVEEKAWDREKGIVKNYEASLEIRWKN